MITETRGFPSPPRDGFGMTLDNSHTYEKNHNCQEIIEYRLNKLKYNLISLLINNIVHI